MAARRRGFRRCSKGPCAVGLRWRIEKSVRNTNRFPQGPAALAFLCEEQRGGDRSVEGAQKDVERQVPSEICGDLALVVDRMPRIDLLLELRKPGGYVGEA